MVAVRRAIRVGRLCGVEQGRGGLQIVRRVAEVVGLARRHEGRLGMEAMLEMGVVRQGGGDAVDRGRGDEVAPVAVVVVEAVFGVEGGGEGVRVREVEGVGVGEEVGERLVLHVVEQRLARRGKGRGVAGGEEVIGEGVCSRVSGRRGADGGQLAAEGRRVLVAHGVGRGSSSDGGSSSSGRRGQRARQRRQCGSGSGLSRRGGAGGRAAGRRGGARTGAQSPGQQTSPMYGGAARGSGGRRRGRGTDCWCCAAWRCWEKLAVHMPAPARPTRPCRTVACAFPLQRPPPSFTG